MLGELNANEIETVLRGQFIGRIGCCHNDKVLVVPITYAYDGKFIYGRTKEGMKIDMMRINPGVCFEVDSIDDMKNWKSVILWGTYEELSEGLDRSKAMEILSERVKPMVASETLAPMIRQPEPHPPQAGLKPVVFRIEITEKTGRFERGR